MIPRLAGMIAHIEAEAAGGPQGAGGASSDYCWSECQPLAATIPTGRHEESLRSSISQTEIQVRAIRCSGNYRAPSSDSDLLCGLQGSVLRLGSGSYVGLGEGIAWARVNRLSPLGDGTAIVGVM